MNNGNAAWVSRFLATALVIGAAPLGCGSEAAEDQGCPVGQKSCAGACVSTTDPQTGCASTTCESCFLFDAVAKCGVGGQCELASCRDSFADCDEVAENGCEVSLSSVENCGACGAACATSAPRATAVTCYQKVCSAKCENGYADADKAVSNGCEKPQLFTEDSDCPLLAPANGEECRQEHWASNLCRYAHPQLACMKTLECVVPLSVNMSPSWKLLSEPCD